ncbi:MAG: helix-hairpin-helix domain-containing protein [Candidatus Thorarchaeota archaeon]|jgi:DNA polymerase III alpha subunit
MSELDQYFTYQCETGLQTRGLANKVEYRDRLNFEMETIIRMGFPGYFLIMWDIISWAKRQGIYIGPGRGSAAGCLASYSLRITDLDPIRWNLLFERFLNPDRISMPDIDFDIETNRRDEVIQYAIEKYGNDKVAHIGTFNTQRARAAVRSVAKTLGHSYSVGDELAKLLLEPVHGKPQPLSSSIERVTKLNDHVKTDTPQGEVLRWAEKIENRINSVGVHASGVVISNTSLLENVPLFRGKGGEITTQWEMNNIEEVGLIKFDFLGLDALTRIRQCVDLVKERHQIQIDINNIDLEHEDTLANLRAGDAVGVFQLEASSGMRDLLVQIRPTSIEDLIALVAIYRPGPLCLSGDTKLLTGISNGKNRKNFKTITLKDLYDVYRNKTDKDIAHHPRFLQSANLETLSLLTNKVKRVHYSGPKEVYRLKIQTGLTKTQRNYKPSTTKPQRRTDHIKSTKDHHFLTLDGWKPLRSIQPGDYIALTYSSNFGCQRSDIYGKKNFANIAFRHYQYKCVFCDWEEGALDVNHIEGNRNTNNSSENLSFLCPNHHRMYSEGSISKEELVQEREQYRLPVSDHIMYVRFLGAECTGIEDTFDVEMKPPYNNFIAGDFVVHNSSDYKQTYLDVRAGKREPEYLVPELEGALRRTSGWCIYQEQVMEIAKQLCGYTGGQADELRKAIGKKKQALMDKHEELFKNGWIKNGLPKEAVDKLWSDLVSFASYAFNRSHAASYAYITYQTAYLKTRYPTEFMCAAMITDSGNTDQIIKFLTECKRLEINVKAPDINRSQQSFHIDRDGDIRFGLGPIKNLGASAEKIIEEREKNGHFKSFKEFCDRVDLGVVNRTKIESLIRAGAFDCFGHTRGTLLGMVEPIWTYRNKHVKSYLSKKSTYERKKVEAAQRVEDIEAGKRSPKGKKLRPLSVPDEPQLPLFPELMELDELSPHQIQKDEHELLGFYVSSHPLDSMRSKLFGQNFNVIEDVKQMPDRTPVSIAAVISSSSEITTKKKTKMAFLAIEDLTGSIEATVFPNIYKNNVEILTSDEALPLRFEGYVDVTEVKGKRSRLSSGIVKTERIEAVAKASRAREVAELLSRYTGDTHEIIVILETQDGTKLRCPRIYKIANRKGAFLRELLRINDE